MASGERWRTALRIAEEALEHEPEQRQVMLELACGGDEALRSQVARLLATIPEMDPFLEAPAVAQLDAEAAVFDPGTTIGPYRIERMLGRGGMGAVYLGIRPADEFHRHAAIKVMRVGLAGESVVRRFRTERQILAALEHPNIARLYEGGTTNDDLPYLAMEYVEGSPIDTYCREKGLQLHQRLQLFCQVCEAVSFAHRNLVVHRDLKPSNILVTAGGEPKLLDFGIAKLLDPASFPQTVEMTQTGMRLMSPAYASPEQLRGQPITTASDVYSLGILLYRLLTGRLPRRFTSLSPPAIEAALQEEPKRPSTEVTGQRTCDGLQEADGEVFSPATAHALRSQLVGDLDNIVLKALREEPEQRYGSVRELAEDLQRHLDGLPVQARPHTLAYRTRKFLRRNRVAVGVISFVVTLLLAFSISTLLQARRVAAERDNARAVAEFMVDLFEVADPGERSADEITARDILDRGEEKIKRELAGRPMISSELLHAVGAVYCRLGVFDKGLQLLDEALAIRESLYGSEHPELLPFLNAEGFYAIDTGDLERAEQVIGRALTIAQRSYDDSNPHLATILQTAGKLHYERGEYELAIPYLQRALEIREKVLGPEHPDTAESQQWFGDTLSQLGRYEEADAFLSQALQTTERVMGPDHSSTGRAAGNLGLLRWRRGDQLSAAQLLRRDLEISERTLGPDHGYVGNVLNNLALVTEEIGDLAEAEALYRRALDIKRHSYGPRSARCAATLNNYAYVVLQRGELAKAGQLWQETLEICRTSIGTEHEHYGGTLLYLAVVDMRLGAYDRAEQRYLEGSRIVRQAVPAGHPSVASCLRKGAMLHFETGELSRAEEMQRQALEIWEKTLGVDHPTPTSGRHDLGLILVGLGRYDEAKQLFESTLRTFTALQEQYPSPQNNLRVARVRTSLADWYRRAGDTEQAHASYQASLRLLESNPEGAICAEHLEIAATCLLRLGRGEAAVPLAESLLAKGWRRPAFVELCRELGLPVRS